jgi:hypothetical protein
MQLIAFHSSKRLAGLKWGAAGTGVVVAAWLAMEASSPVGWLAALIALVTAVLALRVPGPDCRLRLRREGWCELFAARPAQARESGDIGVKGREMIANGAFEGAGWLVLRLRERGASGWRGASRTLVLAPDAGHPEDLRQLRVWLRLAAPRAALNSGGA